MMKAGAGHTPPDNRDGVIKYRLEFVRKPCVSAAMVEELSRWRHVLYRLQVIGCSPDRYGGYGFGNISVRCPTGQPGSFLISGTQTGSLPFLTEEHVARVTGCNPHQNRLVAEGLVEPSSEALTHAQLYQLEPAIQAVIHAHSPDIWGAAGRLSLPCTGKDAAYGTPEMADAVERLFRETGNFDKKVFVMQGHTDGVVSFGTSITEASQEMIAALALSVRYRSG